MEKIIDEEQFFQTYLKTNQIKKIHKDQILELFSVDSGVIKYLALLTNRLFYCVGKLRKIRREIASMKKDLDNHLGTPAYEEMRTQIETMKLKFRTIDDPYFIMGMEADSILHTLGAFAYSKKEFSKCVESLEAIYTINEENEGYVSEIYDKPDAADMDEILRAIAEAIDSIGDKNEARDTLRSLRYAKFFFTQFFAVYKPKLPFHMRKGVFFEYIENNIIKEEETLGIAVNEEESEDGYHTPIDLF